MKPLCKVFGECGGCQYQDISYEEELSLKQEYLTKIFDEQGFVVEHFERIVASPREYHYRSRLDMKFLRTRDGKMFMGFSPADGKWLIEISSCPIAMTEVSDFLPRLKEEASLKATDKHRNANLVVKTGDDGRVVWGGIGKRSLKMKPEDYLWTDIGGKKIFYSLDTFFQANLSILPLVMERIRGLNVLGADTRFYDLYGGVGLFGIALSDAVKEVILIEENVHSIEVAKHNIAAHGFSHFQIITGRVEDVYPAFLQNKGAACQTALVDPPRQGLAPSVATAIAEAKNVDHLLYLSCHPESLMRDLAVFKKAGWKFRAVIPFDFFPRTRHIETLVYLQP